MFKTRGKISFSGDLFEVVVYDSHHKKSHFYHYSSYESNTISTYVFNKPRMQQNVPFTIEISLCALYMFQIVEIGKTSDYIFFKDTI